MKLLDKVRKLEPVMFTERLDEATRLKLRPAIDASFQTDDSAQYETMLSDEAKKDLDDIFASVFE